MPLSHVCVWDADIGYKRISLESACKMYPNGASAKSGYFVCELCAQNVLLTAPGVNVRHFRHDPSSPNKECDERQAHFDPLYGRRLRSLNSHLMPLRITVAKESFALQMGFFCPPDFGARCDKIRITTNSGKAYEYSFERIERGGTTYLNIGETPGREYNLEYINTAADLVKFWPSKVPGISSSGSFFDERTGQILPSGAKAYFGDSYYLLQSKPLGYPPTGLEVSEVLRTKTGSLATWYLYKIQIKRFSEITAKFFLKYAIFLTEHPTKFYPIWPAYLQDFCGFLDTFAIDCMSILVPINSQKALRSYKSSLKDSLSVLKLKRDAHPELFESDGSGDSSKKTFLDALYIPTPEWRFGQISGSSCSTKALEIKASPSVATVVQRCLVMIHLYSKISCGLIDPSFLEPAASTMKQRMSISDMTLLQICLCWRLPWIDNKLVWTSQKILG